MHVNGLIDDNILDLAHLDEGGGLAAWRVAGGQLYAQRADDEQGLVVYLHKVDVKHHAGQGDEYSTWQNSCVLCEEEHSVRQQPHTAGVHHHLTHGHFGDAHSELPAEAGVTLTVQRYGFAINIRERLIFHHERDRNKKRRVKTSPLKQLA